ncbi:MAG: 4-(cytidine 5'-diphospho)-2-C-methyl-D-erythritol kinase [Lachnospiraceae bacterium]|nr:4-(cytidine 5'-diphospho)-2-C-methyl-D-erythritol kinase [Lachnospiraceae bacterium]
MTGEIKAYAKLNLSLDVLEKKSDGYHSIRSVMQHADVFDTIRVTAVLSNETSIRLSCKNPKFCPGVKWDETNLAYKAAKLVCDQYNIKFALDISVEKNIPVGAGLAGGSADAAAVMRLLNDMLDLSFTNQELIELGTSLGADIPFCLTGGTQLCEDIGQKLTLLSPFPCMDCIIVKPKASLETKKIYELCDGYLKTAPHPDTEALVEAINSGKTKRALKLFGNFMEEAAISLCPEILEIKEILKNAGAATSQMTGSGSAVFGLFESTAIDKAYKYVSDALRSVPYGKTCLIYRTKLL